MGRSFKQRKLKKVRRTRVKSVKPTIATGKKDKKSMKTWEYFLLGGALLIAVGFIVFAARTGSVVPEQTDQTPTVVERSESE